MCDTQCDHASFESKRPGANSNGNSTYTRLSRRLLLFERISLLALDRIHTVWSGYDSTRCHWLCGSYT